METTLSPFVRLPVSEGFTIPDERLFRDPSFVQEVLFTGVKVVKEKEAVDARAVLDTRHQALLDKYKKEQEDRIKNFEKREAEYLALCEEQEAEITRKVQELKRLQQEFKDATMVGCEQGIAIGKKESEGLLAREKEALAEVKEELASRKQELDKAREDHKKEMELLRQEKDAELNRFRLETADVLKSLETTLNNVSTSVDKKLDTVNSIFKGKECTSTDIGKLGETFARTILENNFNPCKIKITADEEHSADLLVEIEGVHIRVEVKNKKQLERRKDLVKFHDDIKNHYEEGYRFPAALFVQLQDTALIDGNRTVFFETRHGMPVIYCGDVLASGRILFVSAVRLLIKMARSGSFAKDNNDESSEDDLKGMYQTALEEHKKTATEFMLNIYHQDKDLRQDKKNCEERLNIISERQNRLNAMAKRQADLIKFFPTIEEDLKTRIEPRVGGGNKKAVTDDLKEGVIQWMIKNLGQSGYSGITTTDLIERYQKDCEILLNDYKVRKMGGIQSLLKEAQERDSRQMRAVPDDMTSMVTLDADVEEELSKLKHK